MRALGHWICGEFQSFSRKSAWFFSSSVCADSNLAVINRLKKQMLGEGRKENPSSLFEPTLAMTHTRRARTHTRQQHMAFTPSTRISPRGKTSPPLLMYCCRWDPFFLPRQGISSLVACGVRLHSQQYLISGEVRQARRSGLGFKPHRFEREPLGERWWTPRRAEIL